MSAEGGLLLSAIWNGMSEDAGRRAGPAGATRAARNASGSATVEPGQKPGVDGPSDVRHNAFIAYSHQYREFVLRLRTALQGRGKEVWQDESSIRPAERWELALRRAIEGSDAFIFVISSDSAASPECRKELDHALTLNKRVVPVV